MNRSLSKSITKDVKRLQSMKKSPKEVLKQAKKSGLRASKKMKSILSKQKSIRTNLSKFKTKLLETQKNSQKRLSRSISSKKPIPVKKSELENGKSNVKETMKILSSMEKNQIVFQKRLALLENTNIDFKERLKQIDELERLTKEQASFSSKIKNMISSPKFWFYLGSFMLTAYAISSIVTVDLLVKSLIILVSESTKNIKEITSLVKEIATSVACIFASYFGFGGVLAALKCNSDLGNPVGQGLGYIGQGLKWVGLI